MSLVVVLDFHSEKQDRSAGRERPRRVPSCSKNLISSILIPLPLHFYYITCRLQYSTPIYHALQLTLLWQPPPRNCANPRMLPKMKRDLRSLFDAVLWHMFRTPRAIWRPHSSPSYIMADDELRCWY
jgi:hypothetical protein